MTNLSVTSLYEIAQKGGSQLHRTLQHVSRRYWHYVKQHNLTSQILGYIPYTTSLSIYDEAGNKWRPVGITIRFYDPKTVLPLNHGITEVFLSRGLNSHMIYSFNDMDYWISRPYRLESEIFVSPDFEGHYKRLERKHLAACYRMYKKCLRMFSGAMKEIDKINNNV